MSARRLLSNALLLLSLAGCATALPPPRQPVSEEARRALDLLVTRWHAFSDLRTLADITVERGGERQRLTGVLLAKAPASFRLEALSPFGQPFLFVVIHDGTLTAYNATTNEGVRGPASAETAARLFSLPFDPDDLVAVLAGVVAPPKDLRVAEVMPADEEGPSLSLAGRLHAVRVWMDFETGLVRKVHITGGRVEARVSYLRERDGRVAGFDLTAAPSLIASTVRYRGTVVDAGIPAERFAFNLPQGARIERLP